MPDFAFHFKPCAERVLMTFANQYESYVVPLLKTTYDQTVGMSGHLPTFFT